MQIVLFSHCALATWCTGDSSDCLPPASNDFLPLANNNKGTRAADWSGPGAMDISIMRMPSIPIG